MKFTDPVTVAGTVPFAIISSKWDRFGGLLLQALEALAEVGLHLVQSLLKLLILALELLELGGQARERAMQFIQAAFDAALCQGSAGQQKGSHHGDAKGTRRHQAFVPRFSPRSISWRTASLRARSAFSAHASIAAMS